MGYRKKLRAVFGNLKDKGSLIKIVLSTKPNKSSVRGMILHATTHGSSSPPSDHQIATVISLGLESHTVACSCIQALVDRLHGTSDTSVALKCLYTIHNIIGKGSFVLKDQLSMHQRLGGRNFLNLSTFRDYLDQETREMSEWVRWYASILEQKLVVQCSTANIKKEKIFSLLNSDILKEMDVLVEFACQVGNSPDSLHLQRNILVYEVVRLVCEDHRLVQREIFARVAELGVRMMSLSSTECTQLMNSLTRFEDCKERITKLFVNRSRNDNLWDLVKETKAKLMATLKDREKNDGERLLVVRLQREKSRTS